MSKTSKLYDQIKGHLDTFEAEHARTWLEIKLLVLALVKQLVK